MDKHGQRKAGGPSLQRLLGAGGSEGLQREWVSQPASSSCTTRSEWQCYTAAQQRCNATMNPPGKLAQLLPPLTWISDGISQLSGPQDQE